jgi:hypothetical protein
LSFDSDSDTDPDYNPYHDRDAFALEKKSKRQLSIIAKMSAQTVHRLMRNET